MVIANWFFDDLLKRGSAISDKMSGKKLRKSSKFEKSTEFYLIFVSFEGYSQILISGGDIRH